MPLGNRSLERLHAAWLPEDRWSFYRTTCLKQMRFLWPYVELAARRRGPALPLTVRKPRSFYLCALIVGALLLLLAITFNANPAEAAKCSGIRDSARCAAQPDCHFDVNKRRCSQGPRPTEDACVVHVDKVVCTTDTTLGCAWSAEKKKCITKPH